jgi:hypothetical protein
MGHNLRKDRQADLPSREEAVPLGESGGTVLLIGGDLIPANWTASRSSFPLRFPGWERSGVI